VGEKVHCSGSHSNTTNEHQDLHVEGAREEAQRGGQKEKTGGQKYKTGGKKKNAAVKKK